MNVQGKWLSEVPVRQPTISTAVALWCGLLFEELTPFSFSQCLEPCKESWDLKENQCQDLCEVCHYHQCRGCLRLEVFELFILCGKIQWEESLRGVWSNSFCTVTTLSVRLNQSSLMSSPLQWVISWNVNRTIPVRSESCLFASRQVGLEK